jgi:hypothetical protein
MPSHAVRLSAVEGKPMSKYSDVAELASQRSQEFWEELRKSQVAAMQLAERLREFFDAPEDRLSFVKLDRDMGSTEEVIGIGSNYPKMTQGQDGFWYFGLRIHFESPARSTFEQLTLKIGMKPSDKGITVRFERDFQTPSAADLDAFLDWLYRDLIEHYSTPRGQRPRRPGFIE